MRTYFFQFEESRDGHLFVAEARDKMGEFLGVVSEDSHENALKEIRNLAFEDLIHLVDEGHHPATLLYRNPPKVGGVPLSLREVFPLFLRHARRKHGFTQSFVAEQMGVCQQVYARLERPGKSNPTLSVIERLSTVVKEDLLVLA
jgi:DNA-binding XRE family transcriptional regulator